VLSDPAKLVEEKFKCVSEVLGSQQGAMGFYVADGVAHLFVENISDDEVRRIESAIELPLVVYRGKVSRRPRRQQSLD